MEKQTEISIVECKDIWTERIRSDDSQHSTERLKSNDFKSQDFRAEMLCSTKMYIENDFTEIHQKLINYGVQRVQSTYFEFQSL